MAEIKRLEREPTEEMVEKAVKLMDASEIGIGKCGAIALFRTMWDAAPVVYDEDGTVEDHRRGWEYKRGDHLRIRTDFVPGHSRDYLTEGKVYDAVVEDSVEEGYFEPGLEFKSGRGRNIYSMMYTSRHLKQDLTDPNSKQGIWEVVEDDS